ncbi:MAG: hypothetical protein Q4A39_03470 [Eubacteriales bacterium]|nr:hypothetical protein [Eubacteriales bacterium]
MERFVKKLYTRLEGKPELQAKLTGIVDAAIQEMEDNGFYSDLSGKLLAKINSEDPAESIAAKTAAAKQIAMKHCIRASKPLTLANDETAHIIEVQFDPRFLNSVTLCIQGGLEGLIFSRLYKKCTDQIMYCYILTDLNSEDFPAFRDKLLELDSMYDHFRIDFLSTENFAISSSPTESFKKNAGKKQSFWSKLFGR